MILIIAVINIINLSKIICFIFSIYYIFMYCNNNMLMFFINVNFVSNEMYVNIFNFLRF